MVRCDLHWLALNDMIFFFTSPIVLFLVGSVSDQELQRQKQSDSELPVSSQRVSQHSPSEKGFSPCLCLTSLCRSKVGVRIAAVATNTQIGVHTGEELKVRDQFSAHVVNFDFAAVFEHTPYCPGPTRLRTGRYQQ